MKQTRLQQAPKGWLCSSCHSLAVVADGDDGAWCASCALDKFSLDELPDLEAFVGTVVEDFARSAAE